MPVYPASSEGGTSVSKTHPRHHWNGELVPAALRVSLLLGLNMGASVRWISYMAVFSSPGSTLHAPLSG